MSEVPNIPSHAAASALHRELRARLVPTGFFEPAPAFYLWRCGAVLLLYGLGYATLLASPGLLERVVVTAVLAYVVVQGGAVGHDAGHHAVTRHRALRAFIGQLFMTFLGGTSFARWVHNHGRHHASPNDEKDPDLQSDVLGFHPSGAAEKVGFARLVTRWQHHLLPLFGSLVGFYIKGDGLRFVASHLRTTRVDQIALLLHFLAWVVVPMHWLSFGTVVANYLMITVFLGPYLAVIFLPNHMGTRHVAPGENLPFLYQQIATARNVGDSRLLDLIYLGLNHQIEHHLFPAVPHVRLHRGRAVTREFCREHGLSYHEVTVIQSLRELWAHLRAMSRYAN